MKSISLGRIKNYEIMVAAAQIIMDTVNAPDNTNVCNPETIEHIKAEIKKAAADDTNTGPVYQREGLYACCAMVQVLLNFDPKLVLDIMAESGLMQTIELSPDSAMAKSIIDTIKDDIGLKTDPSKVN